jgi:hypothetical protein
MSHRGAEENNQLQRNVEEQLTRLVTQLADCDEFRDDLDDDEYDEFKADTLEQLKVRQGEGRGERGWEKRAKRGGTVYLTPVGFCCCCWSVVFSRSSRRSCRR